MNKLAIFVEGETEQAFVQKLLEEIANRGQIRIELKKARGGRRGRRLLTVVASPPDAGESCFVLIVDCGADNRVKSDVRDEYDNLVKNGYTGIIAIRDVYPDVALAEIPRLRWARA